MDFNSILQLHFSCAYPGYNRWGRRYYRDRVYYRYDCDNRNVEFTEADNVAFQEEYDSDFEQNFSAS